MVQQTTPNEGSGTAVVFDPGTPQAVADVGRSVLEYMPDPESFRALLDGVGHCALCGRALRDEISKLISVGPDCARKYGIPHTLEAATKRLELRKKLLVEIATTNTTAIQ